MKKTKSRELAVKSWAKSSHSFSDGLQYGQGHWGLIYFFLFEQTEPLESKRTLVTVWPKGLGQSHISASLMEFPLCPPCPPPHLANLTFPQCPWALDCLGCEQPGPSSALTSISLGMSINSLHLSPPGCKRIRPTYMSLKSPPAGQATDLGWTAFVCNQVRLPSPEPSLPTCLFPFTSPTSSSYKEGLSLICGANLPSTWYKHKTRLTPASQHKEQKHNWALDKGLQLNEALKPSVCGCFYRAVCLILEGTVRIMVKLWCGRFLGFSFLPAKCHTAADGHKISWDQQSLWMGPCHLWLLQNEPFSGRGPLPSAFFAPSVQQQAGSGMSELPWFLPTFPCKHVYDFWGSSSLSMKPHPLNGIFHLPQPLRPNT